MIIEVLDGLGATGDVGIAAVKPRLRSALSNCEPLQFLGESAQSTTYNWFARSQQCGSLASPLWSGTQTPCVF